MKNLPKIMLMLDHLYAAEGILEDYEFQYYRDPAKAKKEVMDKLMSLISILEDEHYHVAHTEAEGFI